MTPKTKELILNPRWIEIILLCLTVLSVAIYGGRILERVDEIASLSGQVPYLDRRITRVEATLNLNPLPSPQSLSFNN